MGISTSMNAGVSGLNANGNKLATISDNIANSETFGYKTSDVDFASMTVNGKGAFAASGGGKQVNSGGVTTNAVWNIDGKGALQSTQNSTDISIAGRGMLPVTTITDVDAAPADRSLMLMSTGSFKVNADGYLTTSSGMVLQGFKADPYGNIPTQPRDTVVGLEPVRVNLASVAAVPTSEILFNANLPSDETRAGSSGDALPVAIEYFDNLGASQTLTGTFTPTVPGAGLPQTNTWTLTLTDQASGDSGGSFEFTFSDLAATRGEVAAAAQTAASTGGITSSFTAATGEISLDLGNQVIILKVGSPVANGPQYLSQLAASFNSTGVSGDGNPAGQYLGMSIDPNGMLAASYSSGFSQTIYQIPVADVPNLNGLNVLDNQAFSVTADSGQIYLWDAGDGPTGATQGYSLELSTTDVAEELTNLIRTQRAYSSNAKIIQTVDEMLQETTNLKR